MITYSNIKRYDGVPFEQYLKVQGYSHSFLKSEINGTSPLFKSSDKVRLGSLVDAILTQPNDVDIYSPLYKKACIISETIEKEFGYAIKHFESQVNITADAEFNGFKMPVKHRLDWGLKKLAVLDLKVTSEKNVHSLIKFMGYENQLFGYCKGYEVPNAYIIAYQTTFDKCSIINVPQYVCNEFWESKILKFGSYGK